jgi:hypothetical protein
MKVIEEGKNGKMKSRFKGFAGPLMRDKKNFPVQEKENNAR